MMVEQKRGGFHPVHHEEGGVVRISDHPQYPLILIPGLGVDSTQWLDFPDLLLDWEYHTPDLPGVLDDSTPPLKMADTLSGVRDSIIDAGVEGPYHLFGHSLGGMVAMEWLTQYPEEVVSVTAMNSSSASRWPSIFKRMNLANWVQIALIKHRDEGNVEEEILKILAAGKDEVVSRWLKKQWAKHGGDSNITLNMALRQLITAGFWRIEVPANNSRRVQLLVGEKDEFVPPEASTHLAENLPLAKMVRFLRGGHDLTAGWGPTVAELTEYHAHDCEGIWKGGYTPMAEMDEAPQLTIID